jgi:HAD superfamily hydrolase (TIGR01509 family)
MSVPPVRRVRAVVFDLDGLLVNTEELYQEVGGELLRRRGHVFTGELLDQMMGRPSRVALQIMIDWHKLDDTPQTLADETEDIFASLLDERLELMPGAARLLDTVEGLGLPKAIATSSAPRFVRNVLGRLGLEPRFAFVLTSEDVVHGKPEPEVYLKACQRFALDPTEVLVLEDSANGCLAAARAGTLAVAVPGGHSRTHDFSRATMVVDSLADPRIYELLGLSPPG